MDSTANLPPSGRILFFNAAPNSNSAQLWVDSITVLPAPLAYGLAQYSSYIRDSDTPRHIVVRNGTDTTTLASVTRAIHADSLYIAIFTQPTLTERGLLLFPDTATAQLGQTVIRVTNVSPISGAVDVYITPQDADIATLQPTVSNLAFGQSTDFLVLDPSVISDPTHDTLSVQITDAGTKTPSRLNLHVFAPEGQVNDVILIDKAGGGRPISSFVLTKNSIFF
jgi:hypothetical protein